MEILSGLMGVSILKHIGDFFGLWIDQQNDNVTAPESLSLRTKFIEENKAMKVTIHKLREKNKVLTNTNLEFIQQGANMLKVVEDQKDEIQNLKGVIAKYEEALTQRDKDNTEMVKILDSYKEKIHFLMFEKSNLHKLLDEKDMNIKILNSKLVDLRKQNEEFKREIAKLKKD